MNRSPLMATLIAVAFLICVPVLLIQRLSEGVLPTQAYDIPLAVGVIAWIFIGKAILDRDEDLTTLVENRLSPTWQANSLVEQSVFGVGFTGRQPDVESSAQLLNLVSPDAPIDALMPPFIPDPRAAAHDRRNIDGALFVAQPVLGDAPDAAPVFDTEEYVVGRGDTFWSISEDRLGEGRRWQSIQDLNLDREVAPGVHYRAGDSIRIGWTLVVPVHQFVEEPA